MRRVIFPRKMYPKSSIVSETEESVSSPPELVKTEEDGETSVDDSSASEGATSPLVVSKLDEEDTPTETPLPPVPPLPKRQPNVFHSSFSSTRTPPRRVQLSQTSPLGRYQRGIVTSLPGKLFSEEALPPKPGHLERATSAPNRPLVSILHKSSYGKSPQTTKTSCPTQISASSPSLAGGATSPETPSLALPVLRQAMRRSRSEPANNSASKMIHFDPRIWIREFQRSPQEEANTWYSDQDMDRFKRHAMALIVAKDRETAAGLMKMGGSPQHSRAVYTHQALGEASDQQDLTKALQNDRYRGMVAQHEIRRILIVDPHDICQRLFERAFSMLLPLAQVVSVASAPEAMDRLATQSFDVIVVEERLERTFHQHKAQQSGSDLFRSLRSMSGAANNSNHTTSLWIGVSAYLIKDQHSLEASGVDLCWSKPPPKMSMDLRNDLLRRLLIKRGHEDFARELFG